MPISFEIPERILQEREMLKAVAENIMRPISRAKDEPEHERPTDYISTVWPVMRDTQARQMEKLKGDGAADKDKPKREGPGIANLRLIMSVEMMSWGDVGIYLCTPNSGLAGYAIEAT